MRFKLATAMQMVGLQATPFRVGAPAFRTKLAQVAPSSPLLAISEPLSAPTSSPSPLLPGTKTTSSNCAALSVPTGAATADQVWPESVERRISAFAPTATAVVPSVPQATEFNAVPSLLTTVQLVPSVVR